MTVVGTITARVPPTLGDRIALVALGTVLFVPLLGSVHLFDWDEINFAEAAREMIVTGNYLRVQIDFQPFWEKPPLFFWLQAASMHLFGINEFAARFVNALCGIATMLVTYGIGLRLRGRLFGMLWALAFAGSLLPHLFFKSGVIDPVFNLFIFLGVDRFAAITAGTSPRRRRAFVPAGLFVGLAVMTKGPVAFLVVGLCCGAYWVSRRCARLAGAGEIALFVAVVAGVNFLFYGVETLTHGTWFIREFVRYHLRLLTTGDAGHGRPFYFHALVLLFGCFPGSVLAVRAFTLRDPERPAAEDYRRWMMVLSGVVLVLFSIVKTKTVLYASLSWAPAMFLAAWHVDSLARRGERLRKGTVVALAGVGLLVGGAMTAVPLLMWQRAWLLDLLARDRFAAACISREVAWGPWLAIAGIIYLAAVGAGILVNLRRGAHRGAVVLFLGCALATEFMMATLVGRIEAHSQGGAIGFYKELEGRDAYAESLFKSYADKFYTRKQPLRNPDGYKRSWLLTGPIDRPAYFVQRIHKADAAQRLYGLVHVKTDGGFVLLRRDPPQGRPVDPPAPADDAAGQAAQ